MCVSAARVMIPLRGRARRTGGRAVADYVDIRRELWRESFSRAVPYEEYLAASDQAHASKWRALEDKIAVPDDRVDVIGGFSRKMNVLVYSGVWCGDCVRQGPILAEIARNSDRIDLRFREREDGCRIGEELSRWYSSL